ncbi:hypothetical protein Glove_26g186 [Diversispora epigaea]|uniref:Uncharacterized protein n=1 Tax=Diversispora epigaea TaxID=1348612 RepID=A0A397JS77_9GLOM|nr:hypothetical protein Glove_26g186 [Diversispora epigaea]
MRTLILKGENNVTISLLVFLLATAIDVCNMDLIKHVIDFICTSHNVISAIHCLRASSSSSIFSKTLERKCLLYHLVAVPSENLLGMNCFILVMLSPLTLYSHIVSRKSKLLGEKFQNDTLEGEAGSEDMLSFYIVTLERSEDEICIDLGDYGDCGDFEAL